MSIHPNSSAANKKQDVKPGLGKQFSTLAVGLLLSSLAWSANNAEYQVQTVATGFSFPWCVAWLPSGEMLVTERGGKLYRLPPDASSREEISGVPPTYVAGQGGLFDVLADKDFATNQRLYLTLAGGPPEANATELYSATLNGNQLQDIERLHRVTPSKNTPAHYGGRLVQLADGDLVFTTGDGFDFREQAQDVTNQLGKTLRLTSSGQPSAANQKRTPSSATATGTFDPFVYTYGHRNPQGLALDPSTGQLWLTEHGPRGGDELNLLSAGNNYGWPIATFGMDYIGAYVSPYTEYPGTVQPQVQWTPSTAASGLAVYRGDKFPQWQGNIFSGGLVEKAVRRLSASEGVWQEDVMFAELDARIRDVRVSPDGYLYLLTDSDSGSLLKVVPAN